MSEIGLAAGSAGINADSSRSFALKPAPNTLMDRLDSIIALLEKLVKKEHPRPRRLLRLKEAASYISVSPWKLRALIQKGEIRILKNGDGMGGVWLLDVRDLDDWISRSKATL